MAAKSLTCPRCTSRFSLSAEVIDKFAGQKVPINCPKPSCKQVMAVDLTHLQAKKTEEAIPEPTFFGSIEFEHQLYLLHKGANHIGRQSNSNDQQAVMLKTHDKRISRHHITIHVDIAPDGQLKYLLKDASSANGTFINDDKGQRQLTEHDLLYLVDQDTFFLANTQVVFSNSEL